VSVDAIKNRRRGNLILIFVVVDAAPVGARRLYRQARRAASYQTCTKVAY